MTTPGDPSVRIIAAYKLIKGALQLACALGIELGLHFHVLDRVRGVVVALRRHVTSAWSTHAAEFLLSFATPRHLQYLALALVLDGALGLVEGVALRRNLAWATWLVVITTSVPLPFEAYELFHRARVGRLILLLVNLALVALLVRARLRRSAARLIRSRALRRPPSSPRAGPGRSPPAPKR
jgi:uncharacterized membrane protein (DUF2068 family)